MSDADDAATTDKKSASGSPWRLWLRWGLVVLILVILGVEGYFIWPNLKDTWARIGDLQWHWVLACVVAALLSMDSYAQVQRALMRSAGVKVKQRESLAVILASNSVSATMPGGQVLAPAFVYRESRKWGATPVVASWQLVMSGLLAGAGLAVLGLGGALLAGAKTSPFSVVFSVAGFLLFAVVVQYLASHPAVLESAALKVLSWVNNIRDKPADHGTARLHASIAQLEAVKLNRRDGSIAFSWSLFNWVADVACLAFACWAVGGNPSVSGLMVAYAAGKAVGTAVPIIPGGIGVVDLVLVPALTSSGMALPDAVTAVLIYRLISFLLVAIIGWVVIAFRYRGAFKSGDSLDDEIAHDRQATQALADNSPTTPEIPPLPPLPGAPEPKSEDEPRSLP